MEVIGLACFWLLIWLAWTWQGDVMILIYFSMMLLVISIPLLAMAKSVEMVASRNGCVSRNQMCIFNGDLEEKRKALAKNGRF